MVSPRGELVELLIGTIGTLLRQHCEQGDVATGCLSHHMVYTWMLIEQKTWLLRNDGETRDGHHSQHDCGGG